MKLIDTHAHLESLPNLETALKEARDAGVAGIVAVGSDYDSNLRVLEMAAKHPRFVFPALGLHPWDLAKASDGDIERNLALIEDHQEEIVAVGEVGLDYDKRVRARTQKDRQQAVLRQFLSLAGKLDKPVSLHSRYSWKDCFDLVRAAGLRKVVFHWFTGFSSVLQEILAAGYLISATPAAEYHAEHRRAIKEAPLSQLVLETDTPVSYGSDMSEYQSAPKDIVRSLNAVAEIKGLEREVVAQAATENAIQLFGLEKETGTRPQAPGIQ